MAQAILGSKTVLCSFQKSQYFQVHYCISHTALEKPWPNIVVPITDFANATFLGFFLRYSKELAKVITSNSTEV